MASLKWVVQLNGKPGPSNMVEGGHRDGKTEKLFISRSVIGGEVTPGKFEGLRHTCYIPWGGKEHNQAEFEVLINDGKDPLNWVSSANGNVPNGSIAGGTTKDGKPMFIGRAEHEGELICGKVVPSHNVLYVAYGGKEIAKKEYEVLVAKYVTPPGQ